MTQEEEKRQEELEEEDRKKREQFEAFGAALADSIGEDGAPEDAGPMVRGAVQRRAERMKAHGLTEEVRLCPDGETVSQDGTGCSLPGENGESRSIRHTRYQQTYLRRRRYRREGKVVGRFRDLVTLRGVQEERDQSGRTEIIQHDWVECVALSELWHTRIQRCLVWGSCGILVLLSLVGFVFGQDWGSVGMLDMLVGLVLLLICLGFYLLHLFLVLAVMTYDLLDLWLKCRSGYWVLWKMGDQCPGLSSQVVEAAALELLHREMFADQDPEGPFRDVIDTKYRGGARFRSFEQTEEGQQVVLDLYVKNVLCRGRRLRQKREVIRMELFHEGPFREEAAFQEDKFRDWTVTAISRK